MFTTDQLRQSFLDFFAQRGHTVVPSAPLVPDDPSLMFTVAGMVQFKPLFAGTVELPYRRAASSQKCLRAGGKDSDLANVGHTLRHHTFFEMLGNFSFGDYFKKEGIPWAWEYMTEVAKLDPERLYATVFTDDDEAAEIWLKDVGLPEARLARYEEDNFWGPAGGVGACGPSSEIHYYVGDHLPCDNPDCHINCDCDRWLEIYNIVFPQFDQQSDGSRKPLKNRGIDTGMGLERLAFAAQGVESNFAIDIWKPVIDRACDTIGKDYLSDSHITSSVNIVADHTRALAFCIAENILPGNEGRGYVVRKILRRALLHGYLLGHEKPMLYKLVEPIVAQMGGAYPDLKKREEFIAYTIREEETNYMRTLSRGMDRLQNLLAGLKKGDCVTGDDAFKLHDTYGLPIEVTREVADWDGIETDSAGFEAAMAQQKHRSRKASTFTIDFPLLESLADLPVTGFVGYKELTAPAKILAIVAGEGRLDSMNEGQQGIVILDKSPFYAEAGGQAGDTGYISGESGSFDVGETGKNAAGIYLHYGTAAKGEVKVGDKVDARVDSELRANIERRHTATHLLHAALREVLGEGATQSGSSVTPNYLRFDYNNPRALEPGEIVEVEGRVNEMIMGNYPVSDETMTLDEAKDTGAVALFGEKYGDEVRVVSVMDKQGQAVSTELCGGTHLCDTGECGPFFIIKEEALSAGVRRIEAVAGEAAVAYAQNIRGVLSGAAALTKTGWENLNDRLERLIEENKKLNKDLKATQTRDAFARLKGFADFSTKINGVDVVIETQMGLDPNAVKDAVGNFIAGFDPVLIVMTSVVEGSAVIYCGASPGAIEKGFNAGKTVSAVSKNFGGGGGGKPDFAQGGFELGSTDASDVEGAIEEFVLGFLG